MDGVNEVFKEMDTTAGLAWLKTLSSNMKLYLLETVIGGFLIYIISFIIPSAWSVLIQALPIYPFIIATLMILPINGLFSLTYEHAFMNLLKRKKVVDLVYDLINEENKTYAKLMNGVLSSELQITQKKILELIIYSPEKMIGGPRNQSITIKNKLELKIDDWDEYDDLVGRLLIIHTQIPRINHTGIINLSVSPTLVMKSLQSPKEESKLIFLPKHRPLLAKLKRLSDNLSKKQRIHVRLHNQLFILIIEDYKLLEETQGYSEITNLIMLLSQYFTDTLN